MSKSFKGMGLLDMRDELVKRRKEAERASARMKEEWRRDDELARQHEDEQNERDLFED
jgi:phage-related minor tail protein